MHKARINDRVFQVTRSGNELMIDGQAFSADILETGNGKYHIILDNKSYSAEIISADKETKKCIVKIGNKIIPVIVKDKFDELLHEMGIDEADSKKVNEINAPMPGMVLQVMVEKGQPIKKGDAIVILEAMKMENILKSPADGVVKKVHVSRGDKVEKNQVMVNIE